MASASTAPLGAHVTHVLFEAPAGYALFERLETDQVGLTTAAVQAKLADLASFGRMLRLVAFAPFATVADALESLQKTAEGSVSNALRCFLTLNLAPPAKKPETVSAEDDKATAKAKRKAAKAAAKNKGNEGAQPPVAPSVPGIVLGVVDKNLAGAIRAELGYECSSSDVVLELTRAIRTHAGARGLLPLDRDDLTRAQLGLGHAFSRAKLKFNINKNDNMIIQAIGVLDQMDKDANKFAMRIKEWYSWHFPELAKLVTDVGQYARAVKLIGDRNTCFGSNPSNTDHNNNQDVDEDEEEEEEEEDQKEGKKSKKSKKAKKAKKNSGADALRSSLAEVFEGNQDLANAVIAAAEVSMGSEISPVDMLNINMFADRVVELTEFRSRLQSYLGSKMDAVAPNLGALIGTSVAARLIAHAGSLTNLSKCPASTVQILGAEKALFRALKTKSNTPKYGLIYHAWAVGKSRAKHRGRVSRFLANKCAMASRIDAFSESTTNTFGLAMRSQVDERLRYLESGAVPRRNSTVMSQATKAANKN